MPVPILGKPQLIGVISVISFVCTCGRGIIMMNTVDKTECSICNKIWYIEAKLQLEIKQDIELAVV